MNTYIEQHVALRVIRSFFSHSFYKLGILNMKMNIFYN